MIVISTLFKSESLQMTFVNLDLADCDFCIRDDEFWVSHHHKTWVTHVDANSQISELTLNFQTLEVKSTFESKYDINEVSHILCMHQQHFFSFLRKHFYTFVLQIFIDCVHVWHHLQCVNVWQVWKDFSSAHFHVDDLNFKIQDFWEECTFLTCSFSFISFNDWY